MQTRNEAKREETQLTGSRHHIKWKLAPNKMKKPTFSSKNANKNDEANLISFYWNSRKGALGESSVGQHKHFSWRSLLPPPSSPSTSLSSIWLYHAELPRLGPEGPSKATPSKARQTWLPRFQPPMPRLGPEGLSKAKWNCPVLCGSLLSPSNETIDLRGCHIVCFFVDFS